MPFLLSANTTLYPYLAVHMQSLGFGADKAGVLLAITPLVAIMGPPVAGAIADKLGNFKVSHASHTQHTHTYIHTYPANVVTSLNVLVL